MTSLLIAVIYMSFISLGLPDALLGSAWPLMYGELGVPLSAAGLISIIISGGTIISSLLSDRLTLRFGTGRITACSVAVTALALFGFSVSRDYRLLLLFAVPYGLGAGSVDAALNNYVALHYSSRVMSWLHCMWGVGAAAGPYIMGRVLTGGGHWGSGYRIVACLQVVLTVLILLSLPLWRGIDGTVGTDGGSKSTKALSLRQVLAIPGAKQVLTMFFCYCAIEQTAILWASSYLVLFRGVGAETAASFGAMFLTGMTVGRAVNGFLTVKFSDTRLIRMGSCIILFGIVLTALPVGGAVTLAGLIIIGLGCAPVYPCVIHSTPAHFGAERSQAIVGVQMASAYLGSLSMPPVFGLIARGVSTGLLPLFLLLLLAAMAIMHERLVKLTGEA